MAKLSLGSLRTELSRRLSGLIPTTDTTTLNNALDRATRFIDSLCSYTFMQGYSTGSLTASATIQMPSDLNLQKETKLYINDIMMQYVPYSNLRSYYSFNTLMPTAFSYNTASAFQKITATADGATDGVAIVGTPDAPVLVTSITAYVETAFTTGTMAIGPSTNPTLWDNTIAVTAVGDAPLTLRYLPYTFVASWTPRVTLSITGTGSVSVYFNYTQAGSGSTFVLNRATTNSYYMYYTKMMTLPSTGNYCEIPEQWYEIILDVAEYQQKELYRQVYSEEAKANTIERLKQFVREFNSTQEANININDEMIRKGA